MKRRALDFSIQEAGCLLYAADSLLGGFSFAGLHNFSGGDDGWRSLALKGALIGTSLYQDDGYFVRVVLGDLTAEERDEWTARAAWKLNLESGKMVVSGVCDEDLENYMREFPSAEDGGEYFLGCFVELPPGEYAATIYSYPPNDLSGGWMSLADPRDFKLCFGRNPEFQYEKPRDYFTRTRPLEQPPAWVEDGYEDDNFLNFVIHLAPLKEPPALPEFETDGCILWTFRKPERCPKGIRL